MKILIADKLSEKAIADLKKLGATVDFRPDLSAEDLPKEIKDSEILIVRSTKVTADTIKAASALSLIIRAGAGVNTIDTDCASEFSIHVANTPGKNTDAVAELVIGLLIAADRQIVNATNDLRQGKWLKKAYQKACGLKGRTLGIIGLGAIGQAVMKRAKGLEMNVIAWSRSLTQEKADELDVTYCNNPIELAKQADAVTVHLAANVDTEYFIGHDFLSALKDSCILINAARGSIIDTAALKTAIKKKNLRVALDVFHDEPSGGEADFVDTELAKMVTCTPHIGASTDQASEAIAEGVVEIVTHYKQTGSPLNTVNIRDKSTTGVNLVIRHYNRVGVLAGVLNLLREDGINIEEMNNMIFKGAKAASCTLVLDHKPSEPIISKIKDSEHIIQVAIK